MGWYNGGNIPGKRIEPMNWIGGMVAYTDALDKSIENHYQGWHTSKLSDDGGSAQQTIHRTKVTESEEKAQVVHDEDPARSTKLYDLE